MSSSQFFFQTGNFKYGDFFSQPSNEGNFANSFFVPLPELLLVLPLAPSTASLPPLVILESFSFSSTHFCVVKNTFSASVSNFFLISSVSATSSTSNPTVSINLSFSDLKSISTFDHSLLMSSSEATFKDSPILKFIRWKDSTAESSSSFLLSNLLLASSFL